MEGSKERVRKGRQASGDGNGNDGKKLHACLKELGVHKTDAKISALDVLNHLVTTDLVKHDVIEAAYDAIQTERREAEKQRKQREQEKAATCNVRRRHIALRFYYDGAKYSGLAQTIGQDNDNSVEKVLFQALVKTKLIDSRETSGYSRCGRTDKGVSSAGQVVAFQLRSTFPLDASTDEAGSTILSNDELPSNDNEALQTWVIPRKRTKAAKKKKKAGNAAPGASNSDSNETMSSSGSATAAASVNADTTPNNATMAPPRQKRMLKEFPYANMLNNLLPDDIRILGWCPVSDEFSARFSATTRTYRYFFLQRKMSLAKIQQGLDRLVGKHDFRNFCKMDVEKVYNFERVIHSAKVVSVQQEDGDGNTGDGNGGGNGNVCYLLIVGQAFLWHQIRCIAHVIFMIGKGLESPDIISDLLNLERYPGKPSYALAAEQPLVLHDCGYPNLRFGYSVANLWSVSCHLERQWENMTLAAARIRNCITALSDLPVMPQDCLDFESERAAERKKKRAKYYHGSSGISMDDASNADGQQETAHVLDQYEAKDLAQTITWGECLPWLQQRGWVPDPDGQGKSIHVPMKLRSLGTTYEQKIAALQHNDRRRQRYTENVIKKRKTSDEDEAFYKHMTSQGGSGL